MRVVDKLRLYVNEGIENGYFRKGSRLPSYNKLKEKFSTSYATVSLAMSKLEAEGLVNIEKGTGTFIAGGTPLAIKFYCLESTLDFVSYKELLQKHLKKNDISLEVEFIDKKQLNFDCLNEDSSKSYKAILVENSYATNSSDFNFEKIQIDEVNDCLSNFPYLQIGFSIPYYSFSYQIATNCKLLEKIGLEVKNGTDNLSWWENYASICRKNSIIPAEFAWGEKARWPVSSVLGLFFALRINEKNSVKSLSDFRNGYFNTPAGYRLLEILKTCEFNSNANAFFENRSAINLWMGSWLAAQNGKRPERTLEDVHVLPYHYKKRKLCCKRTTRLQCYMHQDISTEEKLRLWELQRLIQSKEFQKEFCSLTGALSIRNDLSKNDYSWYDKRYAAFVPEKNDIIIESEIFNSNMMAYMTGVFEQAIFYGNSNEIVLKCLDAKL